jgi:two-component SAPR family response regulator
MYRFYPIIVSLIINLSIFLSYPQTNQASGIKFNSQNVQRSEKTSIFLNEGNPIELENSFSISFDISFWNYKKFGPILRIDDELGNEIRVVYNQFRNNDTSYIEILEPFHKNQINIPLVKKDLIRNKWFNLKLLVERDKQQLEAFWENESAGKITYAIGKQKKFLFAFGIKEIDNAIDFDVPAMSVKNIILSENNDAKYFWDLNPFNEDPLTDKISSSKIKAINPIWLYQDHQNWKHIIDYKISDQAMASLGVAFDLMNSRLLIDGRDKLIIYDLISGKDSVINYKTKSPAFWNDLFYDHSNQLLYSYFTAKGKVSIYDLKKNEWIEKDTSTNADGYYFGSAKFCYPTDKNLYLLGGYGWYKSKNELFKYDFVKKEWQKVKLKKNEMTPRAWFTFGEGFRKGEYLIYGGFGNESGDQEKGFKSYNDLFLLNMNDSTITKLNLPETNNFSFQLLHNYSYLDKTDSILYFLAQTEVDSGFNISLNSLNLETGKVVPVGNKFWKRDSSKWMYCYLHYNQSTNEFISAIFDSTIVELYSINYPPISETEKTYFESTISEQNYSSIIFISVIGSALVLLFFVYHKKRKANLNKASDADHNVERDYNFIKTHSKNSVKLFGGLWIYDKEGNEISQSLSPKLKEIFLLILMRSINNHHTGITSEELSSIIWPDASPESVKSNRGVAINKIRKLLSDVEGVDLEFSDKLWLIKINNGSSCDYADYLKFCNAFKKANGFENNSIDSLINIVDGGEFLKGISYEWLDSIKFAINNEVISCLKSYFENQELNRNPEKTIALCDMVLSFDSVDQEAIKLKIKTLLTQGKLHIAKSTYSLFVAEYKRLYDEQYPISFEEIIKS